MRYFGYRGTECARKAEIAAMKIQGLHIRMAPVYIPVAKKHRNARNLLHGGGGSAEARVDMGADMGSRDTKLASVSAWRECQNDGARAIS